MCSEYIGTDIRPVFPEERLLLECLRGKPFEFAGHSIWNISGNKYIVDGKWVVNNKEQTYQESDGIVNNMINL